jgi:hypothetical protein
MNCSPELTFIAQRRAACRAGFGFHGYGFSALGAPGDFHFTGCTIRILQFCYFVIAEGAFKVFLFSLIIFCHIINLTL